MGTKSEEHRNTYLVFNHLCPFGEVQSGQCFTKTPEMIIYGYNHSISVYVTIMVSKSAYLVYAHFAVNFVTQ